MDIDTLKRLQQQHKLEPYIQYIRFPKYKNIAPFTKIEFTFPITALVGANGTNKSSLLHALYGSPENNNVGNFWFSTHTDPIKEGRGHRNSFIYGYYNSNIKKNIEVLKTRIKRGEDPNYWEPARPQLRYGMEKMPQLNPDDDYQQTTRWKSIVKNVVLIDFRLALSAFDQYFYYGDLSQPTKIDDKKKFLRIRSKHLNKSIKEKSKNYTYRKKDRIISRENTLLSEEELKNISNILGRNYTEIQTIHHSFFNLDGYTAKISDENYNYTEAFAGSGEFAVIMLVTQIMRAIDTSLILLDEPEVSLHPGAQEKFLEFLGEQVKRHKHQIIFTTHSPALIRGLPPEAIKVLSIDPTSSKVVLNAQEATQEEAFFEIGEPIPGKKIIVVEDRLAEEIIKKSLRIHNSYLLDSVKITHFPGGAATLLNRYAVPHAIEKRSDILYLLDGDQRPEQNWPEEDKVDTIINDNLEKTIKNLCKCNLDFFVDGNHRNKINPQLYIVQRNFLKWGKNYINYLPGSSNPEKFILSKFDDFDDNKNPKTLFVEITRKELGLLPQENNPSADEIFSTQRRYVNQIDNNDPDFKCIAEIIENFVKLKNDDTGN